MCYSASIGRWFIYITCVWYDYIHLLMWCHIYVYIFRSVYRMSMEYNIFSFYIVARLSFFLSLSLSLCLSLALLDSEQHRWQNLQICLRMCVCVWVCLCVCMCVCVCAWSSFLLSNDDDLVSHVYDIIVYIFWCDMTFVRYIIYNVIMISCL